MLIDDFSDPDLVSRLGTRWRSVCDRVMGGRSEVAVTSVTLEGRRCLRLTGQVRLDNNGGFIQAALDLAAAGEEFDAGAYRGLRLVARGNGTTYGVHLRTPATVRPWQSYRSSFHVEATWQTFDLPFDDFQPYRLETPLDRGKLRRIGLVAIGRAFHADLTVAELSLFL